MQFSYIEPLIIQHALQDALKVFFFLLFLLLLMASDVWQISAEDASYIVRNLGGHLGHVQV